MPVACLSLYFFVPLCFSTRFTYYLYLFFFFFFNDTATTEIYTLSLHDALPISPPSMACAWASSRIPICPCAPCRTRWRDRKSTRLNSSHRCISYAVFCLKKKKKKKHKLLTTKIPLIKQKTQSETLVDI